MASLDELFESGRPEAPPPEARRWELLSHGRPMVCEFLRRREGLSWDPARLQVSIPDAAAPIIELPVPWELRLDDWLIAHHAKAPSGKNESERFGFRLDALLEPIEQRYGGGFFNAVLLMYLNEKFAKQPSVREKLDAIHSYPPGDGESASACWQQIEEALATTARTLTGPLGYERPEAESILSDAIGYYLDDRFNISTRKLLGFG